jgi:copper chaperone CopZ
MSQTHTYEVRGMTCEHCAGAVTAEIESIGRVTGVTLHVVPQGYSTITVTTSTDLELDPRRGTARRLVGPPSR